MKPKQLSPGLSGRYKLVATKKDDGSQRVLADWFENVITDVGLNRIGTGAPGIFCLVGSGSTPATASDTQLVSLIGFTNNLYDILEGAQASAPYFGWSRITWRFNPGGADGNVSEVGVGWYDSDTSSHKTFSRALVLDALGDPTTITVLPDEYLDVTYELRMYPPLVDVTGTTDIEGVSRSFVIRAAAVNTTKWSPRHLLQNGVEQPYRPNNINPTQGPLGTILEEASGSGANSSSANFEAYSNNSNRRVVLNTFGLNDGNVSGGIGALNLESVVGQYQISVSPVLDKTDVKTLTIRLALNWARYTP